MLYKLRNRKYIYTRIDYLVVTKINKYLLKDTITSKNSLIDLLLNNIVLVKGFLINIINKILLTKIDI